VDRTQVILSVFQRRASTRIAQLEIELARLKYDAPRVRDQDSVLAQQAGGGGRGGKGHTGAELKKQELRRRISALGVEIEQAQRSQLRRRQRRQELERVALVGYTNAGKSSWMRALTGSDVQVEDALFATLDTTVRALSPATSPRVVLADTVGFLRNLPNHLLASFRSTLDEALDADLLLFVVDAADPEWLAQLEVTREVLREVRADNIPHRILLNKVDRLDPAALAHLSEVLPEALQVSSRASDDVKRVREAIIAALDTQRELAELFVPYQAGALLGAIHQGAHVLSEKFDEAGALLSLRARGEFVAAWRKQLEARAPA
jgi:GTP-binding protein HflX